MSLPAALQTAAAEPLFGVAATVLAYAGAQRLHRRWKWLHPLFVCAGGLIVLLLALDVPYESYREGGDLVAFFLGPATVALGVPLYKQADRIRRHAAAVLSAVTIGSFSSIASAGFLVWLLGGSRELMATMMPKSATSPIAIEIVRQAGGIPELGAVFTVLTGLLGSMIGPELLRLLGIRGELSVAVAVGTAAHGIGTARLIRESETQGGLGGLAMAIAGIVTALAFMPLYGWLHP
ncbi:LrgB family protein [Paenibacillus contaminans]|uniref:LrgB family protein n=1 Tax=Paenibacillus contaminans TaxID=450362 RepID=A0A329LZC2_9BACL|nr:LrgB family protein [Paenibacillus contaminans]RAV12660.1 LrgB family protein [Paenibacillus contaminans]